MDKNAIKKFAINARKDLLTRVKAKALQYGIPKDKAGDPNAFAEGEYVFSAIEKKERAALIKEIKAKGFDQVVEEVAYTWFNRFCALRYMEVNGLLPSHVRVFTDDNNEFKPQILSEALYLDLEGLDQKKVMQFKEKSDEEGLYKYLLITQCNALNDLLPGMFQKISDYTELLLPDNLLREENVIGKMIAEIPEEDWDNAVQIIGWLFQYYNSEKKDEVFASLKKKAKITKENIPAATQLFTPDWIVRYMAENSLGRLWIEGHPNDELKSHWKYYVDEAEQDAEVEEKLSVIRTQYRSLKPEEIKCIDPCCGSGHILAYLFDLLMQIYEVYGVDTRSAVQSIVENNLYGLDIDDRAAQLAYFSVMMKACQYDKRFLRRHIQPKVHAIVESNHITPQTLEYFHGKDKKLKEAMDTIIKELHDAKEYGSIITVSDQDWEALHARFDELENEPGDLFYSKEALALKPLVQVAEVVAKKYDVVVTNPPYMGASNMNAKLNEFIKKHYADYKSDFFSAFVVKCSQMAKPTGKLGFLTPYVWMFIQSYEKMRKFLFTNKTIETLIQFEYSAFEEATVPICTFAFSNYHIDKKGGYFRLTDFRGGMEVQRQKTLEAIANPDCGYYYKASAKNFSKIPGSPVAYWVSDNYFKCFQGKRIGEIASPKKGLDTADNNRFVRNWTEVSIDKIGFDLDKKNAAKSNYKWFPLNSGGTFRKWYGNFEKIINWEKDGKELKLFPNAYIRGESNYFFEGLTWTKISSSKFGIRYTPRGFIFDSAGQTIFGREKDLYYILGFMCSGIAFDMLKMLNPTMNYQVGDISNIPIIESDSARSYVEENVQVNIRISKSDWDAFETSWDFKRHPLARGTRISDAFAAWEKECNDRFYTLKANEEELNRIFIDIYGLKDELTPEVEEKDVTVRKADLTRDVKSFISYAVGCMFGRYSLDVDGLAYAGGTWDPSKYKTFPADPDNVIPISDDEYFTDDIITRFSNFLIALYGEDTLEENLTFIASALGGKGTAREVIRKYFLNDFFKDHCKIYQKRPIYWLFDSGKNNGFKALVYMHRYAPDTLARMRTDYVHEQQARYRNTIENLEERIATAPTSDAVRLKKKLETVKQQDREIQSYEEKIHHLADQMIDIDLDDGVKVNYAKFEDVLARIK